MKWKFDIYDEPEFIRVVSPGDFSAAGVTAMLEDLFSLEEWHFGIPLLLDSRKLDASRTDPLELLEASDRMIGMNLNLAFTKFAVLLRSQESLERAQRLEQATTPALTADIRLFLDPKEALEWLVPAFSGRLQSNNGD